MFSFSFLFLSFHAWLCFCRSHSVLACEWCKEPFYSVVPLYKHCLEMHHEELDEAHKRHLRRTPSPPESQHASAFYTFPSADNRARSSLNSSGTLPTIVSPKRAINLSSASVSGPPSRGERSLSSVDACSVLCAVQSVCERCCLSSQCRNAVLAVSVEMLS